MVFSHMAAWGYSVSVSFHIDIEGSNAIMKCLVVTAHPLPASLCMTLAHRVVAQLQAAGHDVFLENLYAQNFNPTLTPRERETYYDGPYDAARVADQVDHLLAAEAIVLVFPTWWFGFPAVLKGWFDRVWGPGIAYDHARDFGPITPRLKRLKRMLVITTLGAPWWVDWIVMRRPVKKIVKIALLSTSAPDCRFEMLSLYKSEKLTPDKVERFANRIKKVLGGWH